MWSRTYSTKVKGLDAEKKAAGLLFSEYTPNSTPAGTVKHL